MRFFYSHRVGSDWWLTRASTKNWLVPVSSSKGQKIQEDPSLGDDPSWTRMGFLFSGEALTGLAVERSVSWT